MTREQRATSGCANRKLPWSSSVDLCQTWIDLRPTHLSSNGELQPTIRDVVVGCWRYGKADVYFEFRLSDRFARIKSLLKYFATPICVFAPPDIVP